MTEQKERPILMSAPMVRAIIAGRKTQTRRVIKTPLTSPRMKNPDDIDMYYNDDGVVGVTFRHGRYVDCPFGKSGDHLWVRESAYIAQPKFGDDRDANVKDSEGRPRVVGWAASMDGFSVDTAKSFGVKNTPSIHMPRWASRITLEVVSVRVERLQDISELDCEVELGKEPYSMGNRAYEAFKTLWDAINAKRGHSWESNPYVWVISFRKVE